MPTPRALVVDDERDIRNLLSRALREEGIQPDVAVDGAEAAEKCAAVNYDIVLTDLRMPNVHGHALATSLLAQERRPLVIVLTAVPAPALVTDMLIRGVDDYVTKPVNFKLLAAKVRALLNRRNPEAPVRLPASPESFAMTYCKGKSENEVTLEAIEQQLSESACHVPTEVVKSLTEHQIDADSRDELTAFIETLNQKPNKARTNRLDRKSVRLAMPVAAVAINDVTLRPQGWPFTILTYELSRDSLRFVHATPLQIGTIAIRWPMCTVEGDVYPIVQIAGCRRRRTFFDFRGHLLVL